MDIRLYELNKARVNRGLMPVGRRKWFGPHAAVGVEGFDDDANELAEMVLKSIPLVSGPQLLSRSLPGVSVFESAAKTASTSAATAQAAEDAAQAAKDAVIAAISGATSSLPGGAKVEVATARDGGYVQAREAEIDPRSFFFQDPAAKSKSVDDSQPVGEKTAVASYGAGEAEQRAVAEYNAAKGLAPVVAVEVPALPEEARTSLLGKLGEGIMQATGGGAAGSMVGSLLGLGLGGPGLGSGPLPGALGRIAEGAFGTSGLPPGFVRDSYGNLVPSPYARDPQWGRLATAADYAGSTVARGMLGMLQPDLSSIRSGIEGWVSQREIMDTARSIASAMLFRKEVLRRLAYISGLLEDHRRATEGGGAGGYEQRRY